MTNPRPLTDEEMFGASPAPVTPSLKPLTDEEMFGSNSAEPKTMLGKISSIASKTYQDANLDTPGGMGKAGVDLFTPPTSANIPGEFDKKRQILEAVGNKVKSSALNAEGNITSGISEAAAKYLSPKIADAIQKIMGVWGGTAQTLTTLAPMTPGDFATISAGEIAPTVASQALKGTSEAMANRWANTPKLIREGRLEKGQQAVGADVLSLPKDKVGDIAINNKKDAWNMANVADHQLNQQIKDKISGLTEVGIPDTYTGQPTPTANSVSKQDIANSVDSLASKMDASDAEKLMKFKEDWLRGKPDNLDFTQANMERVKLGEEVGKGFEKMTPELSNKVDAQRTMWGYLRDRLGQLSPELDEMLQLQHKIKDIKTSIKPEAALGYPRTSWVDTLKSPLSTPVNKLETNVGLADWIQNRLPDLGHTAGAATLTANKASIPLSEKLKQLRNQ